MSDTPSFDFLATELAEKLQRAGKLGAKLRFVFEGHGVVHVDGTGERPVVTTDASLPADFSVTAPFAVWLDLRAKRLAPHTAILTRKIQVQGNTLRAMKLLPRIAAVL